VLYSLKTHKLVQPFAC